MQVQKKRRKRKSFIWLAVVAVLLAGIVIASAVYVNDYYRADADTIAAFAPVDHVEVITPEDGMIVCTPENSKAGLIFYPGGKVEYSAYVPLMKALAAEGIRCVLLEMPFNLAVLDVNAAEGIRELYPEIEDWYIGGHSLGGSMAASYLADHSNEFEGLLLLGSYSTADLSDTGLDVLSIYGSEDNVLNREKYDEYLPNLPDNFAENVINGGCHAYFGMYGPQAGDGTPTISNEEQIAITVSAVKEWIED